MAKQFNYEVKTTIRLNMHNPDHVLINNVIQNLDPKIFKSKNQFILDACKCILGYSIVFSRDEYSCVLYDK